MTERLPDISGRLQGIRQLGKVVTALRGIAANRAQQARNELPGIDAYSDLVAGAIGQALRLLPEQEGAQPEVGKDGRALVLFGAELGFAGALSDRMLEAAAADLATSMLFLIGTRAAYVAEQQGIPASWSCRMPFRSAGVPSTANRIAEALYGRIAERRLSTVTLLFPRWEAGRGLVIERRALLPLDVATFHGRAGDLPPLLNLAPAELLQQFAEEYIFAALCAAALHSFACECEARAEAMAGARRQIDRRVEALEALERRVRQEEITEEIVELAGSTAAAGGFPL